MKRAALLLLVGGLSSACASASAKTPADRPALEVPPPPPRSIEPLPKPEAPGPEPVSDLPSSSSPAPVSRPRPNTTREAPPRTEQQKPAEPAVAEPPPPTPPAAAPPVPPLRTPNSASGPEAAKQVREAIDRAQKALQSVNFQKLNAAQQRQYNYAKMMLQQCEEQLKGSNFDIARENADKAHRIATELQGR